ncbi:MAG: hypothetical protein AWM53_00998 [Candidatus Dichloromethanomonas elyunquensis]|nr:MAG: hypothetical protein AWM53_00998 [Candidatus Dichloromethanomonas elyunquensis]
MNNLSSETLAKIDTMVERVARKAGYTGRENMTYMELLQTKYEQQRKKISHKIRNQRGKIEQGINKYRHKFSMKPGNPDFAEEIKTYLKDGLLDLMNEGYTEAEAIKITMDKFDEAELNETFDEFVNAFDGFGMEEYMAHWYQNNGEAIGLFYAAFTLLGMTLGAFLGYLLGHTLLNTLIGFGVGLFAGASLGLLSNAIIALSRKH